MPSASPCSTIRITNKIPLPTIQYRGTHLEREIGKDMGETSLLLVPTAGLEQDSHGGGRLAIVESGDLDTAGGVDDRGEGAPGGLAC